MEGAAHPDVAVTVEMSTAVTFHYPREVDRAFDERLLHPLYPIIYYGVRLEPPFERGSFACMIHNCYCQLMYGFRRKRVMLAAASYIGGRRAVLTPKMPDYGVCTRGPIGTLGLQVLQL